MTCVSDFDGVDVVRIESEDRDASVRHDFFRRNFIGNFLPVFLRHDFDGDIFQLVAAVADDCGQRRNAIRIGDYFANLSLLRELDSRAGGAAGRQRIRRLLPARSRRSGCGNKFLRHIFSPKR